MDGDIQLEREPTGSERR